MVEGERAGVEMGPTEEIEVRVEEDGDEVGTREVEGAGGERGEWGPGEGEGVEEEGRGRDEGGVGGKEAEQVAAEEEAAAEEGGGGGGEEEEPRSGGQFEAGVMGDGEGGEDHGGDVVWEAWD